MTKKAVFLLTSGVNRMVFVLAHSIIGVKTIVRATLSRNSIFAAFERNYIRKYIENNADQDDKSSFPGLILYLSKEK